MKVTAGDIDTLARTLWGEARGEGVGGMMAVAQVVINRAKAAEAYWARHGEPHPLFGSGSLATACTAPHQFSCWNRDDPNRAMMDRLTWDMLVFVPCVDAAWTAAKRRDWHDITRGALHYHTCEVSPPWSQGLTPCFRLGKHVFFSTT